MSNVITVYKGPEAIATCGKHCYQPIFNHCDCICSGFCHGRGLAIAKLQVLDNWIQITAGIQDRFPDHTHVVLVFPLASTIVPNVKHVDQAHRNGRPARPHPSIPPGTRMDPGA